MGLREDIVKYKENNNGSLQVTNNSAMKDFSSKYSRVPTKSIKEKFYGQLIPGKIYTFSYLTDTKISDKTPYINKMPIGIYCGPSEKLKDGGRIELFIDLGVIPPYYKAEILTKIYDQYKSEIDSNIKNIGGSQNILDVRYKNLKILLKDTGFDNAYTGFKSPFMKDIRIIDYEDWRFLPYVSLNSVDGKSLSEIYKKYQMKLNSNLRI